MFAIEFTEGAFEELGSYRKAEQVRIVVAIENQLQHEPGQQTRNRKCLRPNPLSQWELRIGAFRVFYNIDEPNGVVKIEAVGHKVGGSLFIRGQEYEL